MRMLNGVFTYKREIPMEVLELISLAEEDKFARNYWYEIIDRGMKGGINLKDEFNIMGYATRIKQNSLLSQSAETRLVSIVDDERNDSYNSFWEIPANSVNNSTNVTSDKYEELENEYELKYALIQVRKMCEVLLYTEGVNLKMIIESALSGIPTAVKSLKDVCTEYELLGEQIKILLSSGLDVPALLA